MVAVLKKGNGSIEKGVDDHGDDQLVNQHLHEHADDRIREANQGEKLEDVVVEEAVLRAPNLRVRIVRHLYHHFEGLEEGELGVLYDSETHGFPTLSHNELGCYVT